MASDAKVNNSVIKVKSKCVSCREYENNGVNDKKIDENMVSRFK